MSLRPRSDEVLASILASFEEFVTPELKDDYAISVGHTITNLLRHLELRVDLERPALVADADAIELLLNDAAAYAMRRKTDILSGVAEIVAGVSRSDIDLRSCTNSALVARVGVLRQALDRVLTILQVAREGCAGDTDYDVLRMRIRERALSQVEAEATWITPAFQGIRR